MDHHRAKLRKTYLNTGLGELAAVTVFIALFWTVWLPTAPADRLVVGAALLPLATTLTLGGTYWLVARSWVLRQPAPAWFGRLYSLARIIIGIMLGLALITIIVADAHADKRFYATLVWLFALLEYLNYFVVRLSYPWTRWLSDVGQWRTPRPVRDMRSARKH